MQKLRIEFLLKEPCWEKPKEERFYRKDEALMATTMGILTIPIDGLEHSLSDSLCSTKSGEEWFRNLQRKRNYAYGRSPSGLSVKASPLPFKPLVYSFSYMPETEESAVITSLSPYAAFTKIEMFSIYPGNEKHDWNGIASTYVIKPGGEVRPCHTYEKGTSKDAEGHLLGTLGRKNIRRKRLIEGLLDRLDGKILPATPLTFRSEIRAPVCIDEPFNGIKPFTVRFKL